MKVLHISGANETSGAGRAVLLTHYALLEQGIDSRVLFLKSHLEEPRINSLHKISCYYRLKRFILTQIDQLPVRAYSRRKRGIFSPALFGHNLRRLELIKNAEIIHLHWVNHGFINLKELPKWKKPIIFTLRDMWAFTGGCHYSFDCHRFKIGCGRCPALGSETASDLSSAAFKKKLSYFGISNITWVAISSWMEKQARSSLILKNKNIPIVYSGVNTQEYKILSRRSSRNELKLPIDAKIILIGATNIREKYKGFEHAKKLLNNTNKEILVVTFGAGCFAPGEIFQETVHFGNVSAPILNKLYNSSDLFLGPSIAEAMGKTFLEAQLCGLPVLCFEQTGPADIVIHNETGYIAKFKDDNDLLTGLNYCLSANFSKGSIRKLAREKFSIIKSAEKYIDIYERSILDWPHS
jgi:glycosyltransferase involved in cell wall biosynthesis